MSTDMAKAILDEAGRTKVAKTVLFHVMGEPTLHPDLIEIVRYAAAGGMDTCLTTNGSHLDEKMLAELIDAGIGKIIISLQTPDERTFELRGARRITYSQYQERIIAVARKFLDEDINTKLTISFLSSPLRRLIIPIYPEVSIADTSNDLKKYLREWAEKIMRNSPAAHRYGEVLKQMGKIWIFKENTVTITENLNFHTRILGDWSIHFDRKNVDANFGYCPGLRENFGILWNGDYTFCCTDFDGRTSTHNFGKTSLNDYLGSREVQRVVKGFGSFRVLHPYCKQCLGDRSYLNSIVKQLGSIVYFKLIKGQ
jgi:sulfatase maturation enzyme AslB (radical SAM superfamily)